WSPCSPSRPPRASPRWPVLSARGAARSTSTSARTATAGPSSRPSRCALVRGLPSRAPFAGPRSRPGSTPRASPSGRCRAASPAGGIRSPLSSPAPPTSAPRSGASRPGSGRAAGRGASRLSRALVQEGPGEGRPRPRLLVLEVDEGVPPLGPPGGPAPGGERRGSIGLIAEPEIAKVGRGHDGGRVLAGVGDAERDVPPAEGLVNVVGEPGIVADLEG